MSVFDGLGPSTMLMIESYRLMYIILDPFTISAAYSPMKQSFGISSAANKPNPVPEVVLSPLLSRNNGGK
jgi:hypothetical protein